MTKGQILALIAAFLVVTLGSFIWYVATWDGAARSAMLGAPSSFTWPEKLPPEAPTLAIRGDA